VNIDQGFDKMMAFAPEPAPFMYMDPWLRTAWRQKYNLSVRGGREELTYFVSGSWEDNDGVLPNDHLNKLSAQGNFGFSPLDGLNLQWNTFITQTEIRNTPTGNNSHGLTLNVYRQERNYLGSLEKEVIDQVLDYDIRSYIDHLITGVTATYTPFPNFSNKLTVGYDLAENELRQVRPYGFVRAPEGRMSAVRLRNELITLDYSGNVSLGIASELRSTVSFGGQVVENDERTIDGYSDHFPGPSDPTLSTGANKLSFEDRLRVINAGFFGQALFDLKNRYFLTLGVRVDGNSAFGEDFGLQPYPKASFAYVISDEPFWPVSLGQMKLRAAYGQSGRAPGAFDAVKTWDPVGWGGEPAFFPRNLGNPDLGPERTSELEVGFEGGYLGGRLSLDFTYYRRLTTDALFFVRQVPSTLFQSSRLENVGEISNSGIELMANVAVLEKPDFGWDVGIQVSTNNSKTEDLGGAAEFSLGGAAWIIEGEPAPVVVANKITNPDEFADPVIEYDARLGPNQPTTILGLTTTLRLPKGIEVYARGEYQGGHFISDGATSNAQSRNIVSWPTCIAAREMVAAGRVDELTALERQRCITENYITRTHIYPADFFKLRELSVRFPLTFLVPGSTSASLSLTAHNWIRWRNHEFPIFDPEMMANTGALARVRSFNEQIPPAATFTASLRLTF
jgi:outer membrane receptor protein involved in Fe transport